MTAEVLSGSFVKKTRSTVLRRVEQRRRRWEEREREREREETKASERDRERERERKKGEKGGR